MTITYQALGSEHAARCAELEQILFPGDDPWTREVFLEEIASPFTYIIGAFTEERILVGYGCLGVLSPGRDPEFEVHTIGVDPAYQGRHIGAALFDEMLAVADEYRGPVYLEVRTDNEQAKRLYHSRGFSVIGIRKNYYQPSGADALTMTRPAR